MTAKRRQEIAVLGAGSWGTTLAVMLAHKPSCSVTLWSAFKEHADSMRRTRNNKEFLGISLPDSLRIESSVSSAIKPADVIVLAQPVKYLRQLLLQIRKDPAYHEKVFISVAKGIEPRSLKTVSGMVHEILGRVEFGVLSGPNIAKEIVDKLPSVAVAASPRKKTALLIQDIFSMPYYRVYAHHDVVGIELAAALKNVIAIACGISDGMGFGTNTKAALVSRGLAEMRRLGKAMRASSSTFSGVAGMGDLVTTCFSPHSRNRFVGEQIARGKSVGAVLGGMTMVAEGVDSVKAAYRLSRKYKVSMPITEQVYKVIYHNKKPADAVKDLMLREKKFEEA